MLLRWLVVVVVVLVLYLLWCIGCC